MLASVNFFITRFPYSILPFSGVYYVLAENLKLSYFEISTVYIPRYLEYLQFSEAFFNGIAVLKMFIGKKCHVICRIDNVSDNDALRENVQNVVQ